MSLALNVVKKPGVCAKLQPRPLPRCLLIDNLAFKGLIGFSVEKIKAAV
jgi:hypothetical protein